jgi:xanthine dehydrogenase iron-sulfur cluster and FAD-binding subunit A
LCRCTGYLQIFEAVEEAMLKIAEQNSSAAQNAPVGQSLPDA